MWIAAIICVCATACSMLPRAGDDPPGPPPGVDPAAVARRAADDPVAFASLDAVEAPQPLPPVAPPAGERAPLLRTPEDNAAAERAVGRGLDAVAAQRWFVASMELEKARSFGASSPELARGLARTHRALGNGARAADEWRRLLASKPDDAEALLEVGIALIDQREPDMALDPLLRLWRRVGDPSTESANTIVTALGAAVRPVTGYALTSALWQTGHDRAGAEAALATLEALPPPSTPDAATRQRDEAIAAARSGAGVPLSARFAEVVQQRASLWQSVGDARCRLGDFAGALDAYGRADACGAAGASLEGRRLHAERGRDGVVEAARAWLARLAADPASADESSATTIRWLAAELDDPSELVAGMRALAAQDPMRVQVLRAAAVVLPAEESAALLRTVAERRPYDDALVGELLRTAAKRGDASSLAGAARHAVGLVQRAPQRVRTVAAQLCTAPATPAEIRAALQSTDASPARDALLVHLLLGWADPRAWDVATGAVERGGVAAERLAAQLAVAGALEEPTLIDAVEDAARALAAAPHDEPDRAGEGELLVQTALIEARVQARQCDEAMRLASAVAARSDVTPWALGVCADAAAACAMSGPIALGGQERDRDIALAIEWSERAISAEPANESPWRTLLSTHDPQGSLAPDEGAIESLTARIEAVRALQALAARLAVQRDGSRGRLGPAVERLAALAERDPADDALVSKLVDGWRRLGRAADAETWLRDRVSDMPSNPAIVRTAAGALVRAGRVDEARQWLEGRLAEDGDDALARSLLEPVLRASGEASDQQRWAGLARERLRARPGAPGRTLELARVELAIAEMDDALRLLALLASDDRASSAQLRAGLVALANATRDPDDRTRAADELTVRFADRLMQMDGDAPLAMHAARLLAGVRLGAPAATIDGWIHAAVGSPNGDGTSSESARAWVAIAQQLVDAQRPDVAVDAMSEVLQRDADAANAARFERDAFAQLANATATALVATRRPDRAIEFMRQMLSRRDDTGWPPSGPLTQLVADGLTRTAPDLDAAALFWQSGRWTHLGEPEGAEALLRATLARDPAHLMARNNLGWQVLERDGPTPEAAQLIETAAAALPSAASVVDSLGWLRFHQDRLDDEGGEPGAVSLLRRAVELSGEDLTADVLEHYGDALWQVGRHDDAAGAWRRAVRHIDERAPRTPTLQALLAHQQRELGLVIRDPRELYEDTYGIVRERARRKVEAFEAGLTPAVGKR